MIGITSNTSMIGGVCGEKIVQNILYTKNLSICFSYYIKIEFCQVKSTFKFKQYRVV